MRLFLFAAFLAVVAAPRPLRDRDSMLMQRIEGNRYERLSYDANGQVEGHQIIDVGQVDYADDVATLSLRFRDLEDGTVTRRFEATWSCRGSASEMLMTLLVVSPERRKPVVSLETESQGPLYPRGEGAPAELEDVGISIDVGRGLGSILGARSRVLLRERRLEAVDGVPDSRHS